MNRLAVIEGSKASWMADFAGFTFFEAIDTLRRQFDLDQGLSVSVAVLQMSRMMGIPESEAGQPIPLVLQGG